ncbi:uncharacterized protein [Hyperolius riggenbachi]|uniref:uncharacterized protein n=1 Tax=Hyperolius riggenbachi TaxID=752182 RepID=UPI0035A31A3A
MADNLWRRLQEAVATRGEAMLQSLVDQIPPYPPAPPAPPAAPVQERPQRTRRATTRLSPSPPHRSNRTPPAASAGGSGEASPVPHVPPRPDQGTSSAAASSQPAGPTDDGLNTPAHPPGGSLIPSSATVNGDARRGSSEGRDASLKEKLKQLIGVFEAPTAGAVMGNPLQVWDKDNGGTSETRVSTTFTETEVVIESRSQAAVAVEESTKKKTPILDKAKGHSYICFEGPLGAHVKMETKEKIWRREYFDIFTLLPLERFNPPGGLIKTTRGQRSRFFDFFLFFKSCSEPRARYMIAAAQRHPPSPADRLRR